jgi:hypothetical protein
LESQLNPDLIVFDKQIAYAKEVPIRSAPYAEITKFGGMSYKSENLIPYPYDFTGVDESNFKISIDNEQRLIVSGIPTSDKTYTLKEISLPVGSYFLTAIQTSTVTRVYLYKNGTLMWSHASTDSPFAFTVDNTSDVYKIAILALSNKTFNNDVVAPMISKNVALPYEPYFEGLRHVKPTAFKSVGVNLWDEQWERGYIDFATGIMYDDATLSRSKNFISVEPNTEYYMYNGSWEQTRIGFYDKDFRILGGYTTNTFTTPSECRYIKFYWLGTVYNHDICINKSDSSINGKYYPYKQPNILAISPAVLERCDGYGYGVNANAYNYVDWVDKKYHKVLSTANIGSYDWIFGGYYAYPNVSNFAKPNGACIANVPNKITNYYINDSGVPVFIFNEGDYANADEVKSAMQGVMLVYELVTPEVIGIPDLPDDNLISVEGGGTIIADNNYDYAVPSEITYQLRSAT